MKHITPLFIIGAIASVGLFTTAATDAAFIIATDGTLGLGNYAYTSPDGTAAAPSTASAGQLPATTDPTPTFFTLDHVRGGDSPTGDEYTFTYSPAADIDNVAFNGGDLFNSLTPSLTDDLTSSGLAGGGAGFYDVYRIHPGNPGVTPGNMATYDVFVNGGLQLTETIDQNAANLGTGENIGRWELIGNVGLLSDTDTLTVEMTPSPNPIGFVSMRASGIMFEYAGPIPEPSRALLSLLGVGAVLVRRRR